MYGFVKIIFGRTTRPACMEHREVKICRIFPARLYFRKKLQSIMFIRIKGFTLLLFLLAGTCFSCTHRNAVTGFSPVEVPIDRFEEDLFSISIYHLEDSIPYLQEHYPRFFPLFTSGVIGIGTPSGPQFAERLKAFVTDFTLYQVSRRVAEVYPDMVAYEQELGQAFGRYAHFFPESVIPRVITCISGFNQSIITDDSLLVISLDKYLGARDEFYKLLQPPVPEYMRIRMCPEKVVPDALLAWVMTEFDYASTTDNLLGQMIYQGRAMYCVKQLLPEVPDTLLWSYTSEQMRFVQESEKSMWAYLVEYKKLFVTDAFTINQFVGDAPFTKDFTQESPGKAAVWIGMRIVESYMRKNPDITLSDLMKETDYQYLLNASRYNP